LTSALRASCGQVSVSQILPEKGGGGNRFFPTDSPPLTIRVDRIVDPLELLQTLFRVLKDAAAKELEAP